MTEDFKMNVGPDAVVHETRTVWSDTQPAFYQPISEERPWGLEEVVALVPGVATIKVLRMRAGTKGRLQRHHFKDEAGYILEGQVVVRTPNAVVPPTVGARSHHHATGLYAIVLVAGDSFHFPPGCIHQEEAITDCVILEVSSPHRNDREGCEEMFGLPVPADALPSTKPEDVTMWTPWWE